MVELVIEKGDNSYKFVTDAGGGPQQRVTMELTLDGYSAPLTAGNFAANVKVRSLRGWWWQMTRISARCCVLF